MFSYIVTNVRDMIDKMTLNERAVLSTIVLLIVFGIVGPSLISSNSTSAVWIGIGLCIFSARFVYKLVLPIFNKLKGE